MRTFEEPTRNEKTGLSAVSWKTNFVNWLTWALWLHQEFDKRGFPEMLTTRGSWPPSTPEAARAFASELQGWRDAANTNEKERDGKVHPSRQRLLPQANDDPKPWKPWPYAEVCACWDREQKRRADQGDTFTNREAGPWDHVPTVTIRRQHLDYEAYRLAPRRRDQKRLGASPRE